MDEVLVNNTGLRQKLFDAAIYAMLFMFALTMCLVGTLHIAEVSIGSGICYIVIGLVDLVMMGLYHKGEFRN
ncbi:MAG: hypothetical protein II492_00395 [Eubacterium sp.]|jgi:hypothetical protein|nr:hypothetical protein [Eubacterium sp.]MEE3399747.1 hypothetical protein [Eubacterium sp.]